MLPRRGTDIVESVLGWALAVLAVVGGVLAVWIGLATHETVDRHADRQARTRTPATAELLDATIGMVPAGTVLPRVVAPVRWTAADGTPRTGRAMVEQGQGRGAAVTIRIDDRGEPVGEPVGSSDAVMGGVIAGISAAALTGTALAGGWWLVRRATFALNARRWAVEWAAVEPQWRRELR
jgi:hypothetical protein